MRFPRSEVIERGNDTLLPIALGALATLGFAPFGWYGLTLLALAGLIGLWWRAGPRRAAWRGWLFGLGHFGTGVYWVYISTYDFGGAPQAVALFLVCTLVIVLAVFPAVVGVLAGIGRSLPRAFWALVWLPAVWLLAELLRAHIGTGFPWLSLGYALTGAPVGPVSAVVGVYGLSTLMVAAAAIPALLLAGGIGDRLLALVLAACMPLALWLLPPATSWTRPAGEPLSVAIIQGNIPQELKWNPEAREPTLARYRNLTEQTDARLVIWPEVAIPALKQMVTGFLDDMDAQAEAKHQTVLTGLLVNRTRQAPLYNTVLALGVDHGRYYKRHLVPFGEYFPVPNFLLPLLDGVNLRYSNFTHGPEEQPPITVDGTALGLSICFEDAFGYEIRKALPQAGLLVNVTNDAWFADSTAPHQHLQIARMRALESGRPLLRAANTGISAVIDANGRIRMRTPQFAVDMIEARVQPRRGATPYVRYGDMPLWLLALGITVIGLIVVRLRRQSGDPFADGRSRSAP